MFRVAANHPHYAFAADDLAVLTDSPYAGSYLHINLETAYFPQ
jgi:hypothetical protein